MNPVLVLLCWCLLVSDIMAAKPEDPFERAIMAMRSPSLPAVAHVQGEFLKAFLAAYQEFAATRDPEGKQRNLEQFTVRFDLKSDRTLVTFLALLKPGQRPSLDTLSGLPVDVTYEVNRQDQRILRWYYNR
jgi:hypothetical protein